MTSSSNKFVYLEMNVKITVCLSRFIGNLQENVKNFRVEFEQNFVSLQKRVFDKIVKSFKKLGLRFNYRTDL